MSGNDLWIAVIDDSIDSSAALRRLGSARPELVAQWEHLESCVEELPSSLTLLERLATALVTSAINGSTYHVRALRRRLDDVGAPSWLADSLVAAPTWPVVDDDRLAVITMFAAKLTKSPESMTEQGVIRLRSVDLTDADVLDVTNVVGYYNYINRVALGLGLR
jgi:uncharacterized peroxidase-related enzyme